MRVIEEFLEFLKVNSYNETMLILSKGVKSENQKVIA